MSMYDTVKIDDDAPIDNDISQRDWQTHQESVGATYRVNSNGELEKSGLALKDDVKLDKNETPNSDQIKQKWFHLDDFNGPIYLNSINYKAVLMVWGGVVKETKFNKIDYESIRNSIDMLDS